VRNQLEKVRYFVVVAGVSAGFLAAHAINRTINHFFPPDPINKH
jgi:hypothetical protein